MTLEEWKFSLEVAWDDPWYRWQSIVTIAATAIGSLFFLWRLIPEGLRSGVLVFHYNLYFGIDEVLPWQWIFAYPAALMLIVLINFFAAGDLFRKDRIASRALLTMSTLFVAISLVGAFFLISVNV
jgi:hypothetical protein